MPIKIRNFSKKHQQKNSKKLEIFLIVFYFILTVLLLILLFQILSSVLSKRKAKNNLIKSKRDLQYGYNDRYNNNYGNTYPNGNEEVEDTDVFSILIVILYVIFIILSLYMACVLKGKSNSDFLFYGVLKFIYMSNNGWLLISAIDSVLYSSGPAIAIVGVSATILVIGTIVYLCKLFKVIFDGFFEHYFSLDMLCDWFKLPFVCVWSFIGLTDPCCYSNTYTVTLYSDGTTSDNKWCVQCFNYTMLALKRLAFIVATLVYFFFLLGLTFIWLIIKIILLIIEKCKERRVISTPSPMVVAPNYPANNVQVIPVMVPTNMNTHYPSNIENPSSNIKYSRNKSQIMTNNMTLRQSNDSVSQLNRRKSVNLNSNRRKRSYKKRKSGEVQKSQINIENIEEKNNE